MRKRVAATMIAAALLGAAIVPAQAPAAFGLHDFEVTATGAEGASVSQAGSHPFEFTTAFDVNTKIEGGDEIPDGEVGQLRFDQPRGFVGDPFAVPRCETVDYLTTVSGRPNCPDATALGAGRIRAWGAGAVTSFPVAVFNMKSPPGVAAKLAFVAFDTPVTIEVGVNEASPNNVVARVPNVPQRAPFFGSVIELWGVPADPAHDTERGLCAGPSEGIRPTSCPANLPDRPFITLPRNCEGPLSSRVEARSWQNPNATPFEATALTPPGGTGCSKLDFSPQIASQTTSRLAESPSGLAFELKFEDEGLMNPEGIAGSDLKKAVVALPDGVTINPSQAQGLVTCSPSQFEGEKSNSAPGAGCPEASKIGAVEVETPLLEDELLKGAAYVATQDDPATKAPGAENPFDSLLAIYLTVKSPRYGINVGLAGKVEPDPETGQVITTFGHPEALAPGFRELPQLPFSNFRLRLREGGRSPLVTPPTCGSFETEAKLTPWSDPDKPVTVTATTEITRGVGGGPCPPGGTQPFEPGFEAGTANNNAGSYSPFSMRLTRRDGDQDMTRFDAILPQGMLAKLKGVSKCTDAEIAQIATKTGKQELANPSCPANSRIGEAWGGAGAGSQLVYVPGSIYLAGPFDGAPMSVVGVVPAVAGPFDVGVVMTRQALVVDPQTGIVKVDGEKSDPIPHILAGIPLRVRDIQVNVDRPQFTLNPTSCDPFATIADIWGGGADVFSIHDDAPAQRNTRFQAANCARLGFKPSLAFRLLGGTKRGGHPALRAIFTPRPGDANLQGVVVRLPSSAFLDQSHIRTICTRVQFAADNCPQGAIYGKVKAFTPLLEEPLEGAAYLRSSNNKLPDLVFDLKGLVDIESSARIDSIRGGIRATFEGTPDAPLTKVIVDMQGGKKGLIVNSRDLCKGRARAEVRMDGHNGARLKTRPVMRPQCGKGRKGKRR